MTSDDRHSEANALRALKDQEATLRAILNAPTAAAFIVDTQGIFLAVNETLARGLDRPAAELVGQYAFGFLPAELAAERRGYMDLVIRTGQAVRYEDERGGRWFDNVDYPVLDPTGRVVKVVVLSHDITARKEAERRLRVTQFAVDHISEAVYLVDSEGRFHFVNDAAVRMLGWSREELVGMRVQDIDPNFPVDQWPVHWDTVKERRPAVFESLHRTKDGWLLPVEITVNHIEYEGIEYHCAVARDITERHRIRDALRESEARFRQIAENVDSVFYMADRELTRTFYVSPAYEGIWGRSCASLYEDPQSWMAAIHPEDRSGVERTVRDQRDSKHAMEYRVLRPDGTVRWVRDLIFPIHDAAGQISRVAGIVEDITSAKAAENALRDSEERFAMAADAGQVGVFDWDPVRDEARWNMQHAVIFGYAPTKTAFCYQDWAARVHPEDRPGAEALIRRCMAERIPYATEYRILRPDVGLRWIAGHGRFSYDSDGRTVRMLGTVIDITERRKVESRLREYGEQMEELVRRRTAEVQVLQEQRAQAEQLAAVGRLAARVAHEINNPLAGIKNSFLLLKGAVPADHPHHSYVGRIEREIDRIARIVRQMFDLYRPEQTPPEEFAVGETIEDVELILRPLCREQNVTLAVDVGRATARVRLPENLLRQVLYNLIINAVEASPAGETAGVTAVVDDQELTIVVADRGSGIAEAVKTKVFEPFFTTKAGNKPGMGLGLSVSKSLVEAMKGTLSFESRPGQGTTFRVTIPVK